MRVEAQDLFKAYGSDFSLHIPSLVIEPGESFGLVGNNGAGKTTFLRLLLDLIEAGRGRVLIDGKEVSKDESWKVHTGSYLDESFLLGFLTVDEFFVFLGLLYGLSKADVKGALDPYRWFLTDANLGQKRKYIRDLSKGNMKKVGVVGAMFLNPTLLVLDEPFANLDPGSQIQLNKLLRQHNERYGTTTILSSHDLEHVAELCRTIAILEDGRVVRQITNRAETLQELKEYFSRRLEPLG